MKKKLDIPDLLQVQKIPYKNFLQMDLCPEDRENKGLEELLRNVFPVESNDGLLNLEYLYYTLEEPIESIEECLERKVTYEARLKLKFKLTVKEKLPESEEIQIKSIKEQEIYIGTIPLMTEKGSFIINGIERVVVNQLLRCPGVYFKEEGVLVQKQLYSAKIFPSRGLWLEFQVDTHNCLIVYLGRKKIFGTTILKALGYSEGEILTLFYPDPADIPSDSVISNTLALDTSKNREDSLKRIYMELKPGYPLILKEAAKFFNSLFFSRETYDLSEAGRSQINKKLNLNFQERYLTKEDIVETVKYLVKLIEKGEGIVDDIDHLGNKRIRVSAEVIKGHVYEGLVRFTRFIKERMALIDKTATINPQELINSKVFVTVINEFFARNQLSQFLDKTNPLSSLTHKRRVTAVGEGGIKERKRAGFEVRDVHYTHFGKICPIETPEGANIGLINSLTVYSQISPLGFLKTPYYKVEKGKVTDDVVYLSSDEEENFKIATPGIPYDKKTGKIISDILTVRVKGGVFSDVPRDDVEYIGVSPVQIVSISASLIPFLEHDDSNRALMGSNMQRQAVPLIRPEKPLVKTGMEKYVVRDSEVTVKAKRDGEVIYVDGNKIIVRRKTPGIFSWEEEDVYKLDNFKRTNQDTCFHQRPIVSIGDVVENGQIISDGPAVSRDGDLALGKNLLVAFMPWHGYNYEDAILLSERLAKEDVFTSIKIKEFEIEVRETDLGPEEITSDIPNVSEERLVNLDEDGIIRIGADVEPDDILVGKITPRGESELTPEEKLLRVIFGEKAKDVQNTSLRVSPGIRGVVVNIRKYKRKEDLSSEEISKQIKEIKNSYSKKKTIVKQIILDKIKDSLKEHKLTRTVTVKPETWEKLLIKVPDKLKSLFSRIIKIGNDELGKLEKQENNEVIKVRKGAELNPDVICKVVVEIAIKRKVGVGDKMSGRHGNKGVVSQILPEEDMPFLKDGTPVDIVLNPLGVPSRMNIGQILETYLGYALKTLGTEMETPIFQSIKEWEIRNLFKEAGLPEDGKTIIYDGQTGESFIQPVTIGYIYMVKLIHLADEKIHARCTGSYSLITQQPLGGRSQFGGQRFGEMEVWALEGYGAAHTLREILTVKSDDTEGRKSMYESIAKGIDYRGENIPESFNVLKKELQGLGFDMRVENKKIERKGKDAVTIRIALPMVIRSWSHGEIKKAETLNYRTFKPERDGLFCERIFGPTKDYECACGKYKKMRYKGIICDRCGVEVTTSRVRRERMGHIELACPVSYVWLFKSASNWMGTLLDMSQNELEMVLYYERYVVIDGESTSLKEKDILTEEEYYEAVSKFGDKFKANIGAEAIQGLLKKVNLSQLETQLKEQLKKKKAKEYGSRRKLIKKLRMVQGLLKTQVKPEYMITGIIPVIPPDLRPLLPLDGGRFVASDLNDLYQRVINRNNRLKKLLKLQAPDIIVRNEKRMLQEAVDALMDNGKHGTAVIGKGRRPLKSLSDALRGKQGRFRQNLLGKRVDYSGRAVIVVGPGLKMNECGIPKEMALELFGPFVLRELRKKEYFHTLGSAKRALAENKPEVWEILERVSAHHPVFLNRQPTLHRLSIQAFEPRLIEGNVIRVHPLVCGAYNADFDGDTMSIHIPLSIESQIEAELLMKATSHVLSPASGRPVATPSRDIVLGCYYLTYMSDEEEYPKAVSSFDEVKLLNYFGYLELHRPVRVKNENGDIIITTAGRVIFNEIVPTEISFQDELFNHSGLEELIIKIYDKCGYEKVTNFLDSVKELGFQYATLGGMTIGIEDLKVPSIKKERIDNATKEVERVEKNYRKGLISEGERYNRIVDIWTTATNEIGEAVIDTLAKDTSVKPFRINSVIAMVNSGARGNRSQINQLVGMRGLMIRPTKKVTGGIGEIIETPVISNFREGLSLLEYFVSIHGGRKGLVDTALKTSDAGYLSRRLVDVAHSVIVSEEDCGTFDGVLMGPLMDGDEEMIHLKERIIGRVALNNVVDIVTDEKIVKAGEIIDSSKAERIINAGINRIKIRSVLTCKSEKGVCAQCYGWDLSRKKKVNFGEAIGIIAAQSIGEPGTQLTLRTFHTGGTASRSIGLSRVIAKNTGYVKYHSDVRVVKNSIGKNIVILREGNVGVYDNRERELEKYTLRVGSVIEFKNGEEVKKEQILANWDPYSTPVIADVKGKVKYKDIVIGKTAREEIDSTTGLKRKVIIVHKEEMDPQIRIVDNKEKVIGDYHVPVGCHLMVEENQKVKPGDVLAKTSRTVGRVQDITGGLPRISELFEKRNPKNPAVISEIDGDVEVSASEKGGRLIKVINRETGTEKEYLIPYGKNLIVSNGDYVIAGSKLTDGPVVLTDILRIQGEKKVQEYLLDEIQKVYRVEGVTLDDKHIEVIIRQMLSKVRVEEPGDTYFLEGEEIDRIRIQKVNESLPKGKKPATYKPQMLGITRVALSSDSFISAASFQETTKVLTNAALMGAEDNLEGLKENVILGRLIPAGTGFAKKKIKEDEKDKMSEYVSVEKN